MKIYSFLVAMFSRAKMFISGDNLVSILISGSVVALVIKVISAAAAFLMNIFVARSIGQESAGVFFLAYTILILCGSFSMLGLGNTFIRFIASYKQSNNWPKINGLYSEGLFWAALMGTILGVVTYLFADELSIRYFNTAELGPVLKVLSFALPFYPISMLTARALQGLKKITASMLVLSCVIPLTLIVFILATDPLSSREIAIYLCCSVLSSFILGLFFWYREPKTRQSYTRVNYSEVISSCKPMLITEVLRQLSTWAPLVLLGALVSVSDVAYFNAAQRTAALIGFILIAVNSIAAPMFSALFSNGQLNELRKTAQATTHLMTVVALVPFIFILFFSELILSLFGDVYIAGALALKIIAAGQFINVSTGSVGFLLAMTGNEKTLRNNSIISAVVTILLSLWLVKEYGTLGAAISVALNLSLYSLLCVWEVKKKLGFYTFFDFKKTN